MKDNNSVGGRLRILREACGLEQDDVANAVGYSRAYIDEVENGKETPSRKLLHLCADHYGFPLYAIENGFDLLANLQLDAMRLTRISADAQKLFEQYFGGPTNA